MFATLFGGVISRLLANLYLRWFDVVFHRREGPAHWAGAKLVCYADDFVVLARSVSPKLEEWIEQKIGIWISGDQQVHARAPHAAREASQPAALPTA